MASKAKRQGQRLSIFADIYFFWRSKSQEHSDWGKTLVLMLLDSERSRIGVEGRGEREEGRGGEKREGEKREGEKREGEKHTR